MTFNPDIPVATQSPGVFPAQNQANMGRLKTIINSDHIFNNTAPGIPPNNDGTHRRVTLTNSSPIPTGPVPTDTNGIFYSFFDANNKSQLAFWDGTIRQILTPYETLLPIKVVGSQSLLNNADISIFNVTYDWAGTVYSYISVSPNIVWQYAAIIRVGSTKTIKNIEQDEPGPLHFPNLFFTGTDLRLRNTDGNGTQTCGWSIIVNRLS